MTQKEEIVNLLDYLDDTLDEREMELLVSYFYALSIRNYTDLCREEVQTIRDLLTDWGEVLDSWLAYRVQTDNPFLLPFPVDGGQ